jgi:hypothetical protein
MQRKQFFWLLAGSLVMGCAGYWYLLTHEFANLRPIAVDWDTYFYPATRLLLQGHNPYEQAGFFNPVWALLPLVPFALLGKTAGGMAWFAFSLFTFAYVAYRLGAKPVALAGFLLSPFLLYELYFGNIDALALWGLVLPAPVGLFFALMKPQVGVATAAYLAYRTWRDHGWLRTIYTFLPVSAALALSFLVYGNWMGTSVGMSGMGWNVSGFPWTVPIGIGMLAYAVWRGRIGISAAASPMFSPYLSAGSWSVFFMSFLENNLAMVSVVGILWIMYFLS